MNRSRTFGAATVIVDANSWSIPRPVPFFYFEGTTIAVGLGFGTKQSDKIVDVTLEVHLSDRAAKVLDRILPGGAPR